eukprot:403369017
MMIQRIFPAILLALIYSPNYSYQGTILDLSDLDNTLKNEPLYSPLHNKSVEWGTYKPNLYFGVKNRQMNALTFGLFLYNEVPDNQTNPVNISHQYVEDSGVSAYYQFHDGTSASKQKITDDNRQMIVETEFQKELETNDLMGKDEYISRWTTRITFNLNGDEFKGTPVLYIAKEGKQDQETGFFEVTQNDQKTFYKAQQQVDAQQGIYEMIEIGSDQQVDGNSMIGLEVSEDLTWQISKIWNDNYAQINDKHGLVNTTKPNILFFRPTKVVDGLQFAIRYTKQKFTLKSQADAYSEIMNKDFKTVMSGIDANMAKAEQAFKDRYASVFGDGYKDFVKTMPLAETFGHEILAQLLGGMIHMYGPIRIMNETDPKAPWYYDEPAHLFTASPSRPKFPRGFLWDEGFHSQITCQWSKLLCMDVLSHWFNSIKENGWIPREQMRGKEAESNLNYDLFEDPNAGNPPSFIFVLQYLVESLQTTQDARLVTFLEKIYPRVELWFNWFDSRLGNTGENLKGTYQWLDNTKDGALSSGLDDYPRGFREGLKKSVHSDLQGWMITFAKFMATFLDEVEGIVHHRISNKTSDDYRNMASAALSQFRTWCYDSDTGLYTDRLIYEENPPMPSQNEIFDQNQANQDDKLFLQDDSFTAYDRRYLASSVKRRYKTLNDFSANTGIINMFPVAFNLFQGNLDRLEDTLRFGVDADTIFSPYGLRGVSTRDLEYFPGTGYWRGPIWVSVNYLVLRGLYKYYLDYTPRDPLSEDGTIKTPKDYYQVVRQNLAQVIYDNWEPQHLLYENFNDVTGQGQYSHPFSGWTTLMLLIMNEKYI